MSKKYGTNCTAQRHGVQINIASTIVLTGWLILLFVLLWLVMRCVKGMGLAEQGQAVENVKTWMVF